MKRFTALLLALLLALSLAACGGDTSDTSDGSPTSDSGEPIKFIFAHGMSDETCFGPMSDTLKEELEKSGLFEVEVYGAGALGSEAECIQSVQIGDIQAYMTAAASYTSYSPAMYVFDRMFTFTDADVARQVVNDEEFLAALNEELAKANFHVVNLADLGFRQTFSSKKLTTIDDFAGLDFRVMENQIHMQGWSDVGVNPIPVSFSELYTSLQQGVVAGHENVLSSAYSSKVYEVQPYMINTNHIFNVTAMMINNDWYQALPEEAREAFDAAVDASRTVMLEAEAELTETYLADFEASGMEISECSQELHDEMVSRMTPSWDLCRELAGEELYDLFSAKIEQYS